MIEFLCPQRNIGGGGHKVFTLLFVWLLVGGISPILFEVGIPNLMCGCILG